MGFMSAFVKASAYALTKQPTVNAVIEGQEIIYRDFVDVSVAVATPKVIYSVYSIFCFVFFSHGVSSRLMFGIVPIPELFLQNNNKTIPVCFHKTFP